MPVYMIIEVEIKDEKLYAEYVERAYQIVVKHGGRYLARGGQVTSLTGDWNPQRIIILEFETI
ncbi:MAG: DUF1330 domain-containing protein, partial [Armatimonadetes bacterium]|nr:DUF1330 domain-containing protein [Armatimonadota bacterium]NIM22972.1 DUF1330 domain-containing protein [Armatimonadota bacterium]NIM66843.1 DUF1330 domain-containing protein [Armatimonadota bacterium]NIM75384.1 DUF1330 domain-containing protein [Armatimonadota bacterium]NIN05031.1 DUF1330 domain-containing protein [Armatimonadota bacterium]